MKVTVTEVYLQKERYNPRCRATIPGAWVAVIELDNGVVVENAFSRPEEHSSVDSAFLAAKSLYA